MEKRILIISGWRANERTGWAPWLRNTLEKRQVAHAFMRLPHYWLPLTSTGVFRLKQMIKDMPAPRTLICHSFGAKVALTALSKGEIQVDGLVLVAPVYRWLFGMWFKLWGNYLDFDQIKASCRKVIIIHSRDDQIVPFQNAEELVKLCQTHSISVEFWASDGRGHYDPKNNCYELPEVIEAFEQLSSL